MKKGCDNIINWCVIFMGYFMQIKINERKIKLHINKWIIIIFSINKTIKLHKIINYICVYTNMF